MDRDQRISLFPFAINAAYQEGMEASGRAAVEVLGFAIAVCLSPRSQSLDLNGGKRPIVCVRRDATIGQNLDLQMRNQDISLKR